MPGCSIEIANTLNGIEETKDGWGEDDGTTLTASRQPSGIGQ